MSDCGLCEALTFGPALLKDSQHVRDLHRQLDAATVRLRHQFVVDVLRRLDRAESRLKIAEPLLREALPRIHDEYCSCEMSQHDPEEWCALVIAFLSSAGSNDHGPDPRANGAIGSAEGMQPTEQVAKDTLRP